ncbi:MAG: hypothetical protein K6G30_06230 [Acetatifactor sp.]|nr:hypothetical protein [Acetatifactor sp.]
MFQSINEIEKFSFEDCQISKLEVKEKEIVLELEALIVMPNNSQNTNYTESYAGTTTVRLRDGKILSGVKEGYQYFDANDVLLESVDDIELSAEEIASLSKTGEGAYLYRFDKVEEEDGKYLYEMVIEMPQEEVYDTSVADSYRLQISFSQAIFEWEVYLNRVQR